jgi:hypothetical protein
MTTRFASAAELLARVLGMPGYQFVVIPHPVSGASNVGLRDMAGAAPVGVDLIGDRWLDHGKNDPLLRTSARSAGGLRQPGGPRHSQHTPTPSERPCSGSGLQRPGRGRDCVVDFAPEPVDNGLHVEEDRVFPFHQNDDPVRGVSGQGEVFELAGDILMAEDKVHWGEV